MESQVKQEKASNWQVQNSTDWKIRIPRALYDKIFMYTNLMDREIAGFGDVEVDKVAKEYKITALRMYKQVVTATSVDQDEKSLLDAMEQAVLSGEDLSKIKFEWHSHVNMGVFWSGTDDECCKTLVNGSKTFFLFFVVNKKGELLARADYLFQMEEHTIQLTNYCIPVVIEEPVDTSLEDIVKADIALYISEPEPFSSHYGGHGYDHDGYHCNYLCESCKDARNKVRWNQDKKAWQCKDCDDKSKKELRSDKTFWAKCMECNESGQGKWEKGEWICYKCLRRKRMDERLEKDQMDTFQDDRGRHWFWGQCDECLAMSGSRFEEYVTLVKSTKQVLCDQCFSEYEDKAKKEVKLLCQGIE